MKSSKPWIYGAVRAFDATAGRLHRRTPRSQPPMPRRILVSNIGHLGDALLTLGMPGALRRIFPGAAVDVLVSSEGERLFRDHSDVGLVHAYDAWLLSRGGGTGTASSDDAPAPGSRVDLVSALRERQFDIAIELRSYVPNSIPLLARSGARYLCGFGTAGFGFLLDHVVAHVDGEHELRRFQRVLDALSGQPPAPPAVPEPDLRHLVAADNGQEEAAGATRTVLHPGTRRRRKRWPARHWRDLATRLVARETDVVVTGAPHERHWLESTFDGLPVDIRAGTLDLPALVRLYNGARSFIGVDSFPAHLAAAAGVPDIVVLWHDWADPAEWAPRGTASTVRILPQAASADAVLDLIAEPR